MKKVILIIYIIALNLTSRAQVISGQWYETFQSMPINQYPNSGWLSSGSFSVIVNRQYSLDNTLSCNLNSSHTVDSVFTPLITDHNPAFGSANPQVGVKIYNWLGGSSVSQTTLGAGDTCYFSIYKYSNYLLSGKELVAKIYSGNYNNGTSGDYLNLQPFNVIQSDTFRIAIHVTRGATGDYWYDFDDFLLTYISSVKEVKPLSSITLFPNPTNNTLKFQLNENIKSIQITDIYGRPIVFDYAINTNLQHEIQINPSLEFGTYFISVKTDKEIINSKFIKN